MTNILNKLKSFETTPDFYSDLKNPLADLNKMMMYVWAESISLKYIIENDILFNVATFQGIPYLWGPPLGIGVSINNIYYGVNLINQLRIKNKVETNEPEILYLWNDYILFNQLTSSNHFKVQQQANEYIYESSSLASLEHTALKSKRKSKKRFITKYNPTIKPYTSSNRQECLELINTWENQKRPKINSNDHEKFISELNVCKNAFSQELPFEGVLGFIDQKIIGFSLGYKHTANIFNCIFEKTDLSFPDASSYIFSGLGDSLKNKYEYINAGEDWGVEYLANAKKKWMPTKTEPSYSLKLIS